MDEPLQPTKLGFVTTSLLMYILFHAAYMLMLPFSAEEIERALRQSQKIMQEVGSSNSTLSITPQLITTTIWVMIFIEGASLLWAYYTRAAILQQKPWAVPSAFILASFALLGFPVLTILGACIFYGLTDKNVRKYIRGEYI